MTHSLPRRLFAGGAAGLLAMMAMAACSNDASDANTVKVGWEVPLTGAYQPLGEDMRDAFKLYLEAHDNKLGGREVELSTADEADGPETSLPAAERLIKQDEVDVLAGIVNGASYAAVAPVAQENKIPLLGAGGRPDLNPDELDGLWHTSWISSETGAALGPWMAENVEGSVYPIGPDYQGGYDQMGGFTSTYQEAGGELANGKDESTWTPWPDETNFTPYFTEIANSDAKAVYAFYAGAQAIDFVTQYAKSEIKDLPLYGAFLTEGSILETMGEDAKGIFSVMNYSPDLDNQANREFVAEWSSTYDRQASLYAAVSWDTAYVLDQAIGNIPEGEDVTPEAINEAVGDLGQIDSPRGVWEFSEKTHAPIQRWYLREVQQDGNKLSNVVIEDLATIGG
ncbi:MAG: ABC transporter substrate-binding protein [Stackebrandtia sp.]